MFSHTRKITYVPYQGTMYCTREAYIAYNTELKDITEKQIPHMTKEKSIAREKGDLRENSEYDAAKHKLIELNSRKRWIEERIARVKIVTEEMVRNTVAGFGTTVFLEEMENREKSSITLAGEWDDVPEMDIISIESPLGKAIAGKKVGETAIFNDHSYHILSITKADNLFGHYDELHPKDTDDGTGEDEAPQEKTPTLTPTQVLEQAYALAEAEKEKDEIMSFLSSCGAKSETVQPLAMAYLSQKDPGKAIKTLNAINDWRRQEQFG